MACGPRPARATPGDSAAPVASEPRDAALPASEAGAGGGLEAAPSPSLTADPAPSFDDVSRVLFADRASRASLAMTTCPESLLADARIRCLYDERFRGDPKAASLAHELFVKWRAVAGVEVAHTMDGGYRGMIRIEPAVPVGAARKHLEWTHAAFADFDAFFRDLGVSPAAQAKVYRWQPITLRFMRSVGARTPAAYAIDWTVAYNFNGSLNVSAEAVRETMFHEIFHLNDAVHGAPWSAALQPMFAAAVKKCGTAIPCLAPYAPSETIVRGGTYYAFQPGNGVGEYAAELALRFYREQRAVLRELPPGKPFKCGPPENARAWALLRDEFFGGVDRVPACP